jgi:hypothetical protein
VGARDPRDPDARLQLTSLAAIEDNNTKTISVTCKED